MPDICRGGVPRILGGSDGGVLLPLGGEAEAHFEPELAKSFAYLAGLLWCLVGVAVTSDALAVAIDKITSRRRPRAPSAKGGASAEVWNATCANLAMAALGSSAPATLLGVAELYQYDFHSGDVGPSTVVGSVAFHLLVVTGVCIVIVPSDDIRKIQKVPAFLVVAACCVVAYVWVFVALAAVSPDVVEWWEALVLLGLLPLLAALAYLADVGWDGCVRGAPEQASLVLGPDSTRAEIDEMLMLVRQKYGAPADVHMLPLLEHEFAPKRFSMARARIHAARCLTGGRRVLPPAGEQLDRGRLAAELQRERGPRGSSPGVSVVTFVSSSWVIQEADRSVRVAVRRSGDCARALRVPYETRDGTARGGQDYVWAQDTLLFGPGEQERVILLSIIDDRRVLCEEEFFVDLAPPGESDKYSLGEFAHAMVTILNDDGPGIISFARDAQTAFGSHECKEVAVEVLRKDGVNGNVTVRYRTVEGTAAPGRDYVEKSGTLLFHDGQASARIKLEILPKGRCGVTEDFQLVLEDASGGARFDADTAGGAEACVCRVSISASEEQHRQLDSICGHLSEDWGKVSAGAQGWSQQFCEAAFPMGGRDGLVEASPLDLLLHAVALPWKLLLSCVPPAGLCGGWPRLLCALLVAAVLAAAVGDLTRLLGCTLGVEPKFLAASVVAIGTSLPDALASGLATVHCAHADAALGSVVGGAAVLGLVGLGVPWTIGSFHWLLVGADPLDLSDPWVREGKLRGWWHDYPHIKRSSPGGFVVTSGDFGLSVAVLTCCALLSLATLAVRRLCVGAELGGPVVERWATAPYLLLLWVFYVSVLWLLATT